MWHPVRYAGRACEPRASPRNERPAGSRSEVKLLLDEMFPHDIAAALVERGHDVVSIQGDRSELRQKSDPDVFGAAQAERRAVVTENIADYLAVGAAYQGDERPHWGLVLTSNRAFPRHRPDRAIRLFLAALDAFLDAHPDTDEPTSDIHWLQRPH